jgi:hypothetical protein
MRQPIVCIKIGINVILKLDYEKSYDRVNLDFLFEILKTRSLSTRWIGWLQNIAGGGLVGATLNGRIKERGPFVPYAL